MAFLNRFLYNARTISELVDQAPKWREQLLAKRTELRGGSFRDATMGICALVAAADGSIDPVERMRVAQLIGADPVLRQFPVDELRNLFEDNCNRIAMDPAFGRAYVMQQVAKCTGKPAEARAVVQLGIMIGNADGGFDQHEAATIREACQVLLLDPEEFGLPD
ncbi:tellurite resistance TerB family protein [Nocardia otitidiscaviarum]|uniref:Tellurite resistance TerB n=1 Tax=Nocardia otitidiscaviarum TaxID=1823 RepID=A0A516NIU9_9NOCA|nr:TerB family tellurite resistance protein [Nocardia otitidiscaviarum]MBF6177012.1 tellurite resistance TerB family protein [Nocardia otitidiscaviarum]MCP9619747.1 TerB family tellurite resistance protein [Nocardia otitidiscaviarum]QDP78822.1 Tellurite resistance TerB [Nocardia otitidiscaviarum]